jgi:hypothetical protein
MSNSVLLTAARMPDGTYLAGSDGDGIYVIGTDNTITRLGRDEGLTSDVVMRIEWDEERGVYWIVTSNSIEYMKDGNITPITTFPYTNNYDVYFDDNGAVWVLSSHGVYAVDAQEMLEDRITEYRLYTVANGLPYPITSNSHSALDADGNPTDSTIPAANVAIKGDLRYSLTSKTIDNGAVSLDDRAINAVAVLSSLASITINFPTATSGKARDFGLRLTVASGITTAPQIVLPQGVVCENADGEAPEIVADGAATILYFTETASGVFLVKGEVLQTITQA